MYLACLNLIMEKQNSNQNVKIENMVGFFKTFDHYHNKLNFGHFFSFPVSLLEDLNMKFRPKFNHGYLRFKLCYSKCFTRFLG